jgi:limonene-1,2-epoxide hydrolase
MPDDPEAIVSAFIAEFDAAHPDIQRLLTYFSDDAVYHNMPVEPARGHDAIERALGYTQRLTARGWEVVNQASTGNTVLNERIDRFEVAGRVVELPVCGVFEIRDGKIAAWRDYFDMAYFQRIIAPPSNASSAS